MRPLHRRSHRLAGAALRPHALQPRWVFLLRRIAAHFFAHIAPLGPSPAKHGAQTKGSSQHYSGPCNAFVSCPCGATDTLANASNLIMPGQSIMSWSLEAAMAAMQLATQEELDAAMQTRPELRTRIANAAQPSTATSSSSTAPKRLARQPPARLPQRQRRLQRHCAKQEAETYRIHSVADGKAQYRIGRRRGRRLRAATMTRTKELYGAKTAQAATGLAPLETTSATHSKAIGAAIDGTIETGGPGPAHSAATGAGIKTRGTVPHVTALGIAPRRNQNRCTAMYCTMDGRPPCAQRRGDP